MDVTSITFAVVAAVVAVIGLWWHITLAKKGVATGRDKVLGGVWAAVVILALGRIMWLLSHESGPAAPKATGPAQVDPAPIKK